MKPRIYLNKTKTSHFLNRNKSLLILLLFFNFIAISQVGIGNTSPSSDALLEIGDGTDTEGVLLPRVSLTATDNPSPLSADAAGMVVYNTNTNGSGSTSVSPGFYYNDGADWIPMVKKIDDLSDGKSEVYDSTPSVGPSVFLGAGTGASDDGSNNMNVGIGYNSMNSIITGANNIGIGYNSMNSLTTGNNNIAIGSNTLNSNISQAGNIAIGSNTLENNTGKHNVAIGTNALTANTGGKNNVAIGNSALLVNTSGQVNVALGPFALRSNLTGRDNMAIGTFALGDLTLGVGHVGVGSYALAKYTGVSTQGAGNTAVGSQSLNYLETGTKNTAIGHQSLQYGTLQEANTAIGHFAGFHAGRDDIVNYNINNTFIGQAAGFASAGDNNVYIGTNAGGYFVAGPPNNPPNAYSTGSDNVFIGNNAGKNSTNGVQSDRLIIQNSFSETHLVTGNFSTGEVGINWPSATPLPFTLAVNGDASKSTSGSWKANSDRRLKKNITTITPNKALEKITSLRGVTYEWNDNQTGIERPTTTQYGFIAQELMEVFPDKVTKDGLGFYQTAYGDYDALFVQAFKELKNQLNEKDQRINELEKQVKLLQEFSERLDALEANLDLNNETVQIIDSK